MLFGRVRPESAVFLPEGRTHGWLRGSLVWGGLSHAEKSCFCLVAKSIAIAIAIASPTRTAKPPQPTGRAALARARFQQGASQSAPRCRAQTARHVALWLAQRHGQLLGLTAPLALVSVPHHVSTYFCPKTHRGQASHKFILAETHRQSTAHACVWKILFFYFCG